MGFPSYHEDLSNKQSDGTIGVPQLRTLTGLQENPVRSLRSEALQRKAASVRDEAAIKYGYRRIKTGKRLRKYRVYVRALSGLALDSLAYRFQNFAGNLPGQVNVRCFPAIAKCDTMEECQRIISKLKSCSEDAQIRRLSKCRFWIVPGNSR